MAAAQKDEREKLEKAYGKSSVPRSQFAAQFTDKVKTEVEVLGRMEPQQAARTLSVFEPQRVTMMLQEAMNMQRTSEEVWDTQQVATLVELQQPERAAKILELMDPWYAVALLNTMKHELATKIIDQIEFERAGKLIMGMDPSCISKIVPRTTRGESVFTEADLKDYREVLRLQQEIRDSAAEITWMLLQVEQVTGGRLGLLNGEGGTWEPYKAGGWRGWVTITLPLAVTAVVFVAFVLEPLSVAGEDLAKLLSGSTY